MIRNWGIRIVGVTALVLAAAAWMSPLALGQAQSGTAVEPMQKTPVFRVEVVSRTTQAVNYRHRGGATKVDFQGTQLAPKAKGSATVESKSGRLEIDAKVERLEPASSFGLEYLTYVLWAITPEGRAQNLGEVLLKDGSGGVRVTTDLQAFGLIVTAEPYFAVTQPSDLVVLENVIRRDTLGQGEMINARYELVPRGIYQASVEPIRNAIYGIDSKAPLELFEARNAVRIARAARADQYAAGTFQKAEQLLKQAEDYYQRRAGRTPIGTVARNAAQTAEDARVITIKRQIEERAENERRAAAEREASARAATEAEAARRAQAEAESQAAAERAARARTEAEAEAARRTQAEAEAENQRREAEARRAEAEAQRAEAEAKRAEAEQSRLAAEQAESQRQAAESQRQAAEEEKAKLRARLLQQFNTILTTRDTPRGLVVNMSDVLFETGRYTLRPAAREGLAKIAGIVLAYPELRLQAEGHTDSVGSDAYNQQLSEKRAGAVRDYLVKQGVAAETVTAAGLGKSDPVASNSTATGRRQNRRVELIVSGEVIGTKIGATTPGQQAR